MKYTPARRSQKLTFLTVNMVAVEPLTYKVGFQTRIKSEGRSGQGEA